MKYYGLHFTSDDGCPVQVIVESRELQVFARSCPQGGEWTAWRRLDVERNADGTLKETAEKARTAERADIATRLANTVNINLQGAVTGTAQIDGANNINITTAIGNGLDATNSALADLANRIAALERATGASLATLQKRQENIVKWLQWYDRTYFGAYFPVFDPDKDFDRSI